MPISPEPVEPTIDPTAADQGTLVDLGLAPEQPEPPAPEPAPEPDPDQPPTDDPSA